MGLRNWASTKWTNTKAWVKRNPTLSGAIAGGVVGTGVLPGVGTVGGVVGGIIAGAALGSQVGRDPALPEPKKDDHEAFKADPLSEGQEAVSGTNYPKGLRLHGGGADE